MSHELTGNEEHGYRFNYKGKPGWHQLGDSYADGENPNAEQAVEKATKGIEFVKVLIEWTVDDVTFKSDRQFNIVRKPIPEDKNYREFGIVGSSWNLQSYSTMSKVFNKLTETYPVETCGVIKHGSVCFLCLKAEKWSVDGDEMISYLVVQLSMRPGESHRVLHTDVRVVCQNTLNLAIGSAALNIKIPHTADTLDQMSLAADIVAEFDRVKEEKKEICEAMAQKELTVEQAQQIIFATYPEPQLPRKLQMLHTSFPDEAERITYIKNLDPEEMANIKLAEERHQVLLQRAAKLRDMAVAKYTDFDTPRFANTAWAAYNACTEVSDWREGRNQFESAFVGSRAQEKERAFKATVKVMEGDELFQQLLAKRK